MEKTSTLSPVKQALLERRLKRASHGLVRRPEIPVRPDRDSAPLSSAQRQMWVIDQMTPGNPAYNVPVGYRIKGVLDVTAMEDSVNEIIKRHEVLRTTFAIKDGEPLQLIHPDFKIKIHITALDHLTGEERERRLQALASEESVKSFELSRLPLIRVSLFKLGEAEHVLIINLHHIVADGLSIGVLLNELDTFYRAFTEGNDPCPPELTVQYGDFALWQRHTMANEAAYARQLEFWRKQLAGTLPVLELPADKPRPALQSFNGSNVFFNLPSRLVQDLKAVGAREGCTFFMTLLAAFQALLHRYTGAHDVVIGTPIAARTPAELAPLIGLILNMVGLRCDVSGDPAFAELLRRTRDTVLNTFSNGDLPLELLMRHLKFERDPSRNPIFQVVLQVLPTSVQRIGDLEVSSFYFDLKFAQFDLTLHLYEHAAGYQGRFEYCTDLFHRETIERLSQNFLQLLRVITRDPDQSISTLPILTAAERQQLLVDWNQTAVDYPCDSCIHELFETQASCTPDTVALEYEGLRLTYAELNARANQVARYLARHGIGPEVMVGICVERSLETVVGILGILKAGGAYVPLDPDYPASRLSFMLEDTAAPVLLTQAKLRDRLPAYAGRTIALDADWPQIALEGQDDLDMGVDARNLAYVIYTSGSTGRPKGTCIEHRSVVRLVKSVNYVELGPQEVFLQFAPISFDASTLELWGSLLNGARLVVCPAGLLSLQELGRVIRERGVTTLWLTAALFHQMVDEQIESLQGVRQLLAGGETLSVSHVRRMLEVIGTNRLINGYGPTENTTFTCCHVLTAESRFEQTVPIGRPISNTQVYVLDGHMQPVPIGVYGELYVGGDGLAREYLHQPELTAQKFVPDPFCGGAGARLYKTGDLVRFRADGCIEFLGRIDHQVKIRGFRIELGEIEHVLAQAGGVKDAAVTIWEDHDGDKRLVAYYIPAAAAPLKAGELRKVLQDRLPDYMIPSRLVEMEAFPLTPNGKIDRKAFPKPDFARFEADTNFVAPEGELELQLVAIWQRVLKQHRIGATDNFFELGGHSLLATQMIAQIEQQIGVKLPLTISFQAQTIRQLAEKIELKASTSSCTSSVPIQTHADRTERASDGLVRRPEIPVRPDRDSAPLSFAQRQMWVIDQMTPGNPAYILSIGLRLRGWLDSGALENSFNEVIKRHETLRTTFAVQDGEPLQLIHPDLKIKINVTALDHLTGEERDNRLQALASEESVKSFDLSRLPLIRVSLFKPGEAEHVLIINLHHIVADGLSIGLLLNELDTFYRTFTGGGDPRPPELVVQYADFALWQQRTLANEAAYANQIDFWRTQLGGTLPVLELPADKSRPALQSFTGANVFFNIPPALAQDLRSLGAREGCTFFMTLLAAFQVLLQRYSGAEDIVIGTPVAVRTLGEVEPLIGNFLNMAVLRCNLSGDPTFIELLRRSRDTTLDAFSNSDLPFEALMKHLKFERDPSRNPIFQVLLTVLSNTAPRIADLDISSFHFDLKFAQFDLSLQLCEDAGGYLGQFVYCTDLFHAETLERLSANFLELLHAIVRDPQQRTSTIPILAASEQKRILNEWNNTEARFPVDLLIHQLFEAQVERTPERTALRVGATALSYAELDTCATRMAQTLRSRGVSRGQRVGLCIERGADMLAAVLGILKAGAAYVPLDPSFPEDRLRFMADDAQLALLVSTTALASPFDLPRERQLLLDVDAKAIASTPDSRLPVDANIAQPGDPAYVIYTSGSTGKPKGVVVPHRAVVNFLASMAREPGLSTDDVLVAVTTLSFDIAVLELQLPLTLGATVVIATHDETIDGLALSSLLEQHRATVMQATPVTWRLLLEAGWTPRTDFKALVGGEAMPKDLADQLIACGVELWNMYGPTETTVWSTCARITDTSNGITIGKPIANTTVRILDARKSLCPIGVPGELCIGGDGVTLGYWNRPELTADRFIPDPFSTTPGATLYRTGDRARWRNDGMIEHLGRLDFQVKLRGFRIEVGEIEAGIAQHPAVREVAVIAREDAPGDKRLVAYLVAENSPVDLTDQLRALVRAAMPEYMVPAQFVMLQALPRTHNGKLDRKALPAPSVGDALPCGIAVAPRTPTEEMVAGVFRGVLHRTDFGVFDNFFDLGGNSLMAARIMFQLRAASGCDVPLRVLFERQTVSALAEAIDALAWLASSGQQPAAAGKRVEIEL